MTRHFLIGAAVAALAAPLAWANPASPVGLWKNIDDQTGKPKALIRITEANGELRGKIEKLFRAPNEEQNPKCDKCEGEQKDQPIVGMTILSGMKADGDEFNGGKILDPNNGKVYKSKMKLVEGGKKLDVRGYIGMPMLGRTQTWVREE
ncbi:MAG TPA: DUF2147 domain-containing protein [Paucimonas sp.]|nr:DUF2147 domain-containing protein [Paucimonas sp.]